VGHIPSWAVPGLTIASDGTPCGHHYMGDLFGMVALYLVLNSLRIIIYQARDYPTSMTSSQRITKAGTAVRRPTGIKRTVRFKNSELRVGSSKGPDDRAPLPYHPKSDRLTSERLTELADEFEAQLEREAKNLADLLNALDVIALTFQVRRDEITEEIAAQS